MRPGSGHGVVRLDDAGLERAQRGGDPVGLVVERVGALAELARGSRRRHGRARLAPLDLGDQTWAWTSSATSWRPTSRPARCLALSCSMRPATAFSSARASHAGAPRRHDAPGDPEDHSPLKIATGVPRQHRRLFRDFPASGGGADGASPRAHPRKFERAARSHERARRPWRDAAAQDWSALGLLPGLHDPVLLELVVERRRLDAEEPRGLGLHAPRLLVRREDELPLELLEDVGEAAVAGRHRQAPARGGAPAEPSGRSRAAHELALGEHERLLDHVLQLAHVPRPAVAAQQLERLGREAASRPAHPRRDAARRSTARAPRCPRGARAAAAARGAPRASR